MAKLQFGLHGMKLDAAKRRAVLDEVDLYGVPD